jgi:FkbM family methyltransferase
MNKFFFLNHITGLIHIGANTGQERDLYAKHDLSVIWIEPIPDVCISLKKNIENFQKQKAFEYLVTDKDDVEYQFFISNNGGLSSSILELNLHKKMWSNVSYSKVIILKSLSLESIVKKENINILNYQALVIDTQGSELLVLQGAGQLLNHFKCIMVEAADFESYTGCCQVNDLEKYLHGFGFREVLKGPFRVHPDIGTYYDIVYQKN